MKHMISNLTDEDNVVMKSYFEETINSILPKLKNGGGSEKHIKICEDAQKTFATRMKELIKSLVQVNKLV